MGESKKILTIFSKVLKKQLMVTLISKSSSSLKTFKNKVLQPFINLIASRRFRRGQANT